MRQLTQEEAERCAKACGWSEYDQVVDNIYSEFWFPPLWDMAVKFCQAKGAGFKLTWTGQVEFFTKNKPLLQVTTENHPCLALCKFIEILKTESLARKKRRKYDF